MKTTEMILAFALATLFAASVFAQEPPPGGPGPGPDGRHRPPGGGPNDRPRDPGRPPLGPQAEILSLEMRFGEVALDLRPLIRRLGQEVDMHLIGAELRTLMAEMGKVERDRVVLGLAEGERCPRAVVMAADEDVIGSWKGRAADQRVDAMQITPA